MNDPAIDEEEARSRFLLTGPVRADAVAAVLDQLQPAGMIVDAGWDRQLLHVAQDYGAALLVEDDVDPDADGVHLTDPGRVAEMRSIIDQKKHRQILGADVGFSRHDAMVAGEAGADYVAFGERSKSADDAVFELVAWWRQVTVMPSLAYAGDAETAAKLARIGADFIGVSTAIWEHPEGSDVAAGKMAAILERF
ncbi:MAG: thiamine phosphate synthase [Pseudomonadota bacterium]